MTIRHLLLLLCLSAASSAGGIFGLNGSSRGQPSPAPSLDAGRWMQELHHEYPDFHGVVLVARGETLLLERGFGLASRAPSRAMPADALVDWASISKNFTAAAMLRLQMDGKVNLDDPISKHRHGVPAAYRAVTIRQLLNHTSGLGYPKEPEEPEEPEGAPGQPEGAPAPEQDPVDAAVYCQGDDGTQAPAQVTIDDVFQALWELPRHAAPGEQFHYINEGYFAAAALVETLAGQPFETYVQEKLLAPAGMASASLIGQPGLDVRRMPRLDGGRCSPLPYGPTMSWFFKGASGVVASTRDMWRWDRALRTDQVLDARSRKELFTPSLDGYALGWGSERTPQETVWHHSGSVPSMNSYFLRGEASEVVVLVAMTQEITDRTIDPEGLAWDLYEATMAAGRGRGATRP